jgi:hypothetical protein
MSWVVHSIEHESAEIKKDGVTAAGLNLGAGTLCNGTGGEGSSRKALDCDRGPFFNGALVDQRDKNENTGNVC